MVFWQDMVIWRKIRGKVRDNLLVGDGLFMEDDLYVAFSRETIFTVCRWEIGFLRR